MLVISIQSKIKYFTPFSVSIYKLKIHFILISIYCNNDNNKKFLAENQLKNKLITLKLLDKIKSFKSFEVFKDVYYFWLLFLTPIPNTEIPIKSEILKKKTFDMLFFISAAFR